MLSSVGASLQLKLLDQLRFIRDHTGDPSTTGLSDACLSDLETKFPQLIQAVQEAYERFQEYLEDYEDWLRLPEDSCVAFLQEPIVNFYPQTQVNPYVALAAVGPWVITLYGAVLHDSGGYGMLGLGHGPQGVLDTMAENHVMANIMTPSMSQRRLADKLYQEIGHSRPEQPCPFQKFVFMNSGSEAVTVALRIADLQAKLVTDQGARYHGYGIKLLAHKKGFHGRTDRPAQASDSTAGAYQHLASFRDRQNLLTVEANNIAALHQVFQKASEQNQFIEAFLMEPVMGEGNPGIGLTPDYYNAARELTKQYGTLLIVDSIQAGLRAHGCLSILDYPGFEDCEAPDCETYSKALNAGQFPLSILAMRAETAQLYRKGVYGNTMTANPRALEIACYVLDNLSPQLRRNITARGQEFLKRFRDLQQEFPGVVTDVTGTGLLCALHLTADPGYAVVGDQGLELYLRQQGMGVIHGGDNALRFTPHFQITSEEINLMVDLLRDALKRGPVYS